MKIFPKYMLLHGNMLLFLRFTQFLNLTPLSSFVSTGTAWEEIWSLSVLRVTTVRSEQDLTGNSAQSVSTNQPFLVL